MTFGTLSTVKKGLLCAGWLFALAACGSVPEPDQRPSASQSTALTNIVAGYSHTVNSSRFRLGGNVSTVSDSGFNKWVGSFGVFAVDALNGAAGGVANADAPSTRFTLGMEAHNNATVAYFELAGVPQNQVAGVHATTRMAGEGPVGAPQLMTSAWYNSILTRAVAGVPVPDSHAWAEIDSNGDVTAEHVYWPAIPQQVVDDALSLEQVVSDATKLASFKAKLPDLQVGSLTGTVTIRHSSFTVGSPFVAFASYDVFVGDMHSGHVRHFTAAGSEVRLPQESRSTGVSLSSKQ